MTMMGGKSMPVEKTEKSEATHSSKRSMSMMGGKSMPVEKTEKSEATHSSKRSMTMMGDKTSAMEKTEKSEARHAGNIEVKKRPTMASFANCAAIGTPNSKLYHVKGGQYYEDSVVALKAGKRECFPSEAAAIKAGFRKSKV
jgi:hypothetical protein